MPPHDKNAPAPTPGYFTPPLPSDLQVFGPRSPLGDKCEIVMATVDSGGEGSGFASVAFVELPSAKVRARVSIFAAPNTDDLNPMVDNQTAMIPSGWALWVPLLTQAKLGGAAGVQFPTRNVIGTKASPLLIPTDVGLWGYEFEIQTAAQSRLMLRLSDLATGGSGSYQIRAQVTYQAIQPMSPQEWTKFVDRAGITGELTHVRG